MPLFTVMITTVCRLARTSNSISHSLKISWLCISIFITILSLASLVISTNKPNLRLIKFNHSLRPQFEGQDIVLDSKVGIFITMNPGYAGRTELPESVKALFRPVVCIVPDNELICQIKLFSSGFLTAKVLAKKMTVLYKLAREQLSKQNHYDFGLRALKSVLNMAGQLKRTSGDLAEDVVLMRALRDMNLPKFIFDDVPLFLGLIADLFPNLDCPRVHYPDFNNAVNQVLEEQRYIILSEQVVFFTFEQFHSKSTRVRTVINLYLSISWFYYRLMAKRVFYIVEQWRRSAICKDTLRFENKKN